MKKIGVSMLGKSQYICLFKNYTVEKLIQEQKLPEFRLLKINNFKDFVQC